MTLKDIKGVGTKALAYLNKLNIFTIEDLVTHYPFRYEVLKRNNPKDVLDKEKIIIDGRVEGIPVLFHFRNNVNKMNFRLITMYGVMSVSIFNRAYMKSNLKVGTLITIIGKYEKDKNSILASDIRLQGLNNNGSVEMVYHTTSGLTMKNLALYINQAILIDGKNIVDYIPEYLIDKYGFSNKKTALNIVHNPPSLEKLKEATIRLKYEELFEFMFKINYLRHEKNSKNVGISRDVSFTKLDDVINALPFKLTTDQNKVLREILEDLKSPYRMNRLLEGDVGSGKTIVAILAMYYNFLSGYQSALMAPTEILANQHYVKVKKIFKDLPLRVALLTGAMTKKDKIAVQEKLENGEVDVIIGTHALIQDEVLYNNLGLVITDEQHRFGVNQRNNLQNKGVKADVLYMSATPIPRTYALTIYGDMDISIIKELPSGRKEVKTSIMASNNIKDVLVMMYEELKLGHQIYVISPLIEENENLDLTNVNELKLKMELSFGSKYKVGLIHGKMKAEERDKVMQGFYENKVNILISTTVIEVGVDVSNATMMIIFNAERFGLSTLHQLRGRVGRGEFVSTCILISDNDTKRLEVLANTNDGFTISEEDFKLRGQGDLFGTKQSGDMIFKIADLRKDYKILLQAKKDSADYLNNKEYDSSQLKNILIGRIKSVK